MKRILKSTLLAGAALAVLAIARPASAQSTITVSANVPQTCQITSTGNIDFGSYDPIGATNIRLAKELRRESKRARSYSRSDVPFPIPAELRAFRSNLSELSLMPGAALAPSRREMLVAV